MPDSSSFGAHEDNIEASIVYQLWMVLSCLLVRRDALFKFFSTGLRALSHVITTISLVVEDSLHYSTDMTNKQVASSDSLALLLVYLTTIYDHIRDGRR